MPGSVRPGCGYASMHAGESLISAWISGWVPYPACTKNGQTIGPDILRQCRWDQVHLCHARVPKSLSYSLVPFAFLSFSLELRLVAGSVFLWAALVL